VSLICCTAWFDGPKFTGDAAFRGAEFAGTAWFNEAEFTGTAWFDGAKFTGAVTFGGAEFTGYARFGEAEFVGAVTFGSVVRLIVGEEGCWVRVDVPDSVTRLWPARWTVVATAELPRPEAVGGWGRLVHQPASPDPVVPSPAP
jgi:hypothetical protein